MSLKISVKVFSQGVAIASESRPVRILPDGTSGVVHAGAVYPLHRGDEIHLEDQPYDKSECEQYVESSDCIVYASARATNDAIHEEVQAIQSKYAGPLETTKSHAIHRRRPSDAADGEVWITQAGECYHWDSDCVLLRKGRAKGYEATGHATKLEPVSLAEAAAQGRRSCSHCG